MHHHSHNTAGKSLLASLLINIGITLIQFIGGLISGSLALLSDALHNFSDVLSLIISYIAHKISGKKADFSKTFGYKRAEIIAAFINAASLILIALYLIKESVFRFFEKPEPIGSGWVIWLAILSIVGNGICVLLLEKKSHGNMNVRSSYLHLLTDMFTSVGVMVAGILMKYYQIYWVDSLLTFLIGSYLIYTGYGLLKSSFKMLLLFSPEEIIIEDLVKTLMGRTPQIKNIHHVHIWQLNENEVHLEAHVDLNENIAVSEFDVILEVIKQTVHDEFGINHINIQPEFAVSDPKTIIVQD